LLCLRRRKFVVATTDSNHNLPVYPNLAGSMKLTGIDQLWIADRPRVGLVPTLFPRRLRLAGVERFG